MDNSGSDGNGFPNNSHRGVGRGRGRGSGGKLESRPLRKPQDATAPPPATGKQIFQFIHHSFVFFIPLHSSIPNLIQMNVFSCMHQLNFQK